MDPAEQQAAPLDSRLHSDVLNKHGLPRDDLFGEAVRAAVKKTRVRNPLDRFSDDTSVYSKYVNTSKGNFRQYIAALFSESRIDHNEFVEMGKWYTDKILNSTKKLGLYDCLMMRVSDKFLTKEELKSELVWYENYDDPRADKQKKSRLPFPLHPRVNYRDPGQFPVTDDDLIPAYKNRGGSTGNDDDEDEDYYEDEDEDEEQEEEEEDEDERVEKRKRLGSDRRTGKRAADADFRLPPRDSSSEDESDHAPKTKKSKHTNAKSRAAEALAPTQAIPGPRLTPKKVKTDSRSHLTRRFDELAEGKAVVVASLVKNQTVVIRIRGTDSRKKLPTDSICYQDICSKTGMSETERGALSFVFHDPVLMREIADSIPEPGNSSPRITDPDIVPSDLITESLAPLIAERANDLLPDCGAVRLVLSPLFDAVALKAFKRNHGTPDIDVEQQVERLSRLKEANSASFEAFKATYVARGATDADKRLRDFEAGTLLACRLMTNDQLQECQDMERRELQHQAMPAAHAQAPEHDWGFVHGSLEHTFALITVKPCNFSAKNWIQELIKGLRENGTMAEVFPGKQAKLLESHFATFLEAIENNRVPRAFVEASNSSGSQVDFSDLRPMLKTAFETLRTKLTEIVPEITMAVNIPQTFQTAEEFLMQQVLDPISHLLALDKEEWSTCTKFSDKVDYDFNTKEFSSLQSDRQPPRAALVFLFTELHLPSKDQVMNRYLGDQAYVDAARKLCDVFGSPADTRVKDLLHPLELEDVMQTMLWVIARNSGKRNADRLGSSDNWNPLKVLTYKVETIEDEPSKQGRMRKGNPQAQHAAQGATSAKGAAMPSPRPPAPVPVIPGSNQIPSRKITRHDMAFLVPLFEKAFDDLLDDHGARVPPTLAGTWEEELRKQLRTFLVGANFNIRLERNYKYNETRDTLQNLMPNIKLSEVCHDRYVTFTESQHKDDPKQQLKAFLMQIGVRLFSIFAGVDIPSFLDPNGFKRAFPKARK